MSIHSGPPPPGRRTWHTCRGRCPGRPGSPAVSRSLRVTPGWGSPEVPDPPGVPARRHPAVSGPGSSHGGVPGWCRHWTRGRSRPAGAGAVQSALTSPRLPGRRRRSGAAPPAAPVPKTNVVPGMTCPGGGMPPPTHVPARVVAKPSPGVSRSDGTGPRRGRGAQPRTRQRSWHGRGTRCRVGWSRCAVRHEAIRRFGPATPAGRARRRAHPGRRTVRVHLGRRTGRPCRTGVASARPAAPTRRRC
jgi:hypothetical protein